MRLSTNYRSNQRYIRDTLEPPCIHVHIHTHTHMPRFWPVDVVCSRVYICTYTSGYIYMYIYRSIDCWPWIDTCARNPPSFARSLARSRLYGKGCCCLRCSKGWRGVVVPIGFLRTFLSFSPVFLLSFLDISPFWKTVDSIPDKVSPRFYVRRQTRVVSIIISRKKLHPMPIRNTAKYYHWD